jgi:hypothetical protein
MQICGVPFLKTLWTASVTTIIMFLLRLSNFLQLINGGRDA